MTWQSCSHAVSARVHSRLFQCLNKQQRRRRPLQRRRLGSPPKPRSHRDDGSSIRYGARTCSVPRMTDREVAAMFYYDYVAAETGIRVIDVNQIDGNVRRAMDQCAAAPNNTVLEAFRRALAPGR